MLHERTIFGLLMAVFIFLQVNFDSQLGSIFLGMAIISAILFFTDSLVTIKVEEKSQRFKALVFAVGAYIALIVISNFIFPSVANWIDANRLFAEQLPALEGSPLIIFIALGLFIPLVETIFFFMVLPEFLKDIMPRKVEMFNKNLVDFNRILMFVIISSAFVYFHLTAKAMGGGTLDTSVLLQVFLFAMLSLYLIVITGQALAAILFHIIANVSAAWPAFESSLVGSSMYIVYAVGLFLFYLFFVKGEKFSLRNIVT